jgi:hypothetical protein
VSSSSATKTTPSVTVPASSVNPTPDAATVAAITAAYDTFFAPNSTDAEVANAVQNGEALTAPLSSQNYSQYQGHTAVKVTKVEMQSPVVAHVTFDVSLDGQLILPGAKGYAVRENGSWKLAATTFCQLLTLEGTKSNLCKDPKETALPTP